MVNSILIKSPKRSGIKKELYKLVVARSDITAALKGCEFILKYIKELRDERLYPLTTAVVVCYARPFTQNKPFGALPEKWSRFSNSGFKDIHDKLIKARNEIFAHSDMNIRKVQIVPPNVSVIKNVNKELKSTQIGTQLNTYFFSIDFFKSVRKLILDLGSRLQKEIDRLIDDLYSNLELPKKEFDLKIDEGL